MYSLEYSFILPAVLLLHHLFTLFFKMKRCKDLETLIILALVPLVLYLIYKDTVFLYSSIILLVIAIFFKGLSGYISTVWYIFSEYLGLVMNTIILAVIYFLILTPLAFLQRLTRNNQILKERDEHSYFIVRNHRVTLSDIQKPW